MFTPITSIERRWLLRRSIIVLVLASLPYLAGLLFAAPDRIFSGLQVNPLDGVSYLAKLQIGAHGDWLFSLRFTAESSTGVMLFTYFVALGQVARVLGLPLIAVFHIARIAGGFALLWSIYALIARVVHPIDLRRRAWWLIALSSGLGWVALLLGRTSTSDYAIPESNTFYSLMANAHFALAMALMIALFIGLLEAQRVTARRLSALSAASLVLAVIQPFAPVAMFVILGGTLLLMWRRDRRWPRPQFVTALVVGVITSPLLIYLYAATQIDPVMQGWSAQNQTPSPEIVDYVLGYGLLIVLAIPAARSAWRRRSTWDLLLLAWIVITLPLLYAPFPLQRRWSLGLHVPIGLLAAVGLSQLARGVWLRRAFFAATLPTSIMIVVVLIAGAASRSPSIYLSADEFAALTWLHDHAQFEDVVLASPEMGAFVPAFAGPRVVYGHPFETVDADRKQQLVTDFFAGRSLEALRGVKYVLLGPRERALGALNMATLPLNEVYRMGSVQIFARTP